MRWSYKTVHYELKKGGLLGSAVLDEDEVELSLNEYGQAGWELVSLMETHDGMLAVFKQPLGMEIEHAMPRIQQEPQRALPEDIAEISTDTDQDERGPALSEEFEETTDQEKCQIGAIRIE